MVIRSSRRVARLMASNNDDDASDQKTSDEEEGFDIQKYLMDLRGCEQGVDQSEEEMVAMKSHDKTKKHRSKCFALMKDFIAGLSEVCEYLVRDVIDAVGQSFTYIYI